MAPEDQATEEPTHDFAADVRSHVNDLLIPKYEKNMPFRLADTYTGLILERYEIISLLKMRKDYRAKLDEVVTEAQQMAAPIDPQVIVERPKLDHLNSFIAEFLAYAMFSHRWRNREATLQDVKGVSHGIYAMEDKDVAEGNPTVFKFSAPAGATSDLPTGVRKLQEFCCMAAKCGFRWAWSDTCCINKRDFAETSESINSMFLWYRCSELTIVYLDDVDDVDEEGRLSALDEEEGPQWFQNPEMRTPLPSPPANPSTSAASAPSDFYAETLETDPYFSLHDRLGDNSAPFLSMRPDSQVERPHLQTLLESYFPSPEDCKIKGKYRMLPIWVTRGWTLQEMVASKRLRFYSRRWTLLEEAEDFDTETIEGDISISSFKIRARLFDHRANDLWCDALHKTTGVPRDDLTGFRPGTWDVRERLLWAARRQTTKVEDMAYCLLGIFDVSLPAIYGEGPRAFFRLQEELMKRTGDVSLFDWCGRCSSVNTFLARDPRCFNVPRLPEFVVEPSNEPPLKMILSLFRMLFGAAFTAAKATILRFRDWVQTTIKSTPPGHTLVNGELNVSLFEHQVIRCVPQSDPNGRSADGYYRYKLDVEGLMPLTVTFLSRSGIASNPDQYCLCRPWDRHTKNVFEILLQLIEYAFEDMLADVLPFKVGKGKGKKKDGECDGDGDGHDADPCADRTGDDEDDPEAKLRGEMDMKRRLVLQFFKGQFPVYLVHFEEERRVRLNTVNRVEAAYVGMDFTRPLVTRLIL